MNTRRFILLVDHGSRRPEANALLEEVADSLRARGEGEVRTAHLEIARPDIGTAIDAAASEGAEELVVVPWFLGPGRHTQEDIPAQVERAAERHPSLRVRIAEPLGTDPAMIDVLLARAEKARER